MRSRVDKTTRFVVIDPSQLSLEGKILQQRFSCKDPRHETHAFPSRIVIDERSSPDERAPAMPASGTFRAAALAMNSSGIRKRGVYAKRYKLSRGIVKKKVMPRFTFSV